MEFTNLVLLSAVIGVVEIVKRLFDKDFRAAAIIAVAAVAGAVFAPYAGEVSWFMGMLYGFAASGVITTVSKLRPE